MSADKKTVKLEWYFFVLFAVVAVVALAMTWWSMFDLSVHTLGVPVWLGAGSSFLFDVLGAYLILLAIKYAITDDSGFMVELFAYAFIATSTYIVAQHGILEGFPTAGIVMFAAAPIALGVLLKVTLQYLTRQQRRAAGRVTERLPSVGWLTWVRYGPQAFKLASLAMQGRLINAADKLDIAQDRFAIFGQAQDNVSTVSVIAVTKPNNVLETSGHVQDNDRQLVSESVRPMLDSSDNMSLPVWLPNEPTMTLATLVQKCLDNSEDNIETIYRYALALKGQEVNKASLSKTLSRKKKTV